MSESGGLPPRSKDGLYSHGVLLKKAVFQGVTCYCSPSAVLGQQEAFGDVNIILLHHPLTVECVYPSSQDGPGRRLRIEIQLQESSDSTLDNVNSSINDSGVVSIPLGRLVGLTSVNTQHTLRIAHSQCIYDDYRVKFVYIRFPSESDLEEFRWSFEEAVRLRDCPEERLDPAFQRLIEESRRESRKQLKMFKHLKGKNLHKRRSYREIEAGEPLMLPPPFQEDDTDLKTGEKLLVTATLFQYQKYEPQPMIANTTKATSSTFTDSSELEETMTSHLNNAAAPASPPSHSTSNIQSSADQESGTSATLVRLGRSEGPPTLQDTILASDKGTTLQAEALKNSQASEKQSDYDLANKALPSPIRDALVKGGKERLRPRGTWKKIAANVRVRVFPFAGQAMITVIDDNLGHYIYTTWVHSRLVCTQVCNSGYPDLFFPAPIKSTTCKMTEGPDKWSLVGLRFATSKDAQLFTEHINRHRCRLLLRETVTKMELLVPTR
ncbi:hypothetical protein BIW11_12180 [Tropilaelaps mercedesae]|uniref:Uncharacterized protein n=1 Tax=Tropilaelaps mercedesae TaxID=418985 RepID=A0A1V9X8E7_9ACAR|nr:hypothetical protein BIW11_12180 [Tropilaelaps mercedesae]